MSEHLTQIKAVVRISLNINTLNVNLLPILWLNGQVHLIYYSSAAR